MKVTITNKDKEFEVYVVADSYGAEVTIYEVIRPKWKIFRTKFFPFCSGWFFLEDYNSVMEGVIAVLGKGYREKHREENIIEKWKNFEKSIDKPVNL